MEYYKKVKLKEFPFDDALLGLPTSHDLNF